MNDESSSSSAALPAVPPPSANEETSPTSEHIIADDNAPSFYFSRNPRLSDLLAVLDRLIWMEVTVMYLLDNSFIRFAMRSMVQIVYLMPRPKGFPEQNAPQPYVGAIIGINILCIMFHLINSAPEAGEATRGYLHGSLMLDFVGQHGPTSKLRLLLLDVFILLLQLVALATFTEKKELDTKKSFHTSVEANNQDHDSEERGEIRGTSTEELESVELQEIGENSSRTVTRDSEARPRQKSRFAVSDNIATGQALIGEFYLLDNVRQVYRTYEERRSGRSVSAVDRNTRLLAMRGIPVRLAREMTAPRNST
ncbi:uncharacterized protein PV09_01970 [Verruconis gallopava]|uniref:DUF1746 domain-containing protein n=1 Tax=Verruconis gallopava TaxID=253628 RepID=A0A0D1XWF9_9PEZI|nr:uncharacterized protein PV09_01970 [Verruconis gallopava]KIW07086.1 hypothetical protein PV09_01970 [Verruconis gallopava]